MNSNLHKSSRLLWVNTIATSSDLNNEEEEWLTDHPLEASRLATKKAELMVIDFQYPFEYQGCHI